jgi:hypothetical protein
MELIGWREWVTLSDLSEHPIKAKIDTGARTSALHAQNIKIITRKNKKWVKFDIFPDQFDHKMTVSCQAELIEKRNVKSSIGVQTSRPLINLMITLGNLTFPIEVTLINRSDMGHRMLIGRQALNKNYLIDPSRSFLLGKKSAKKRRNAK